MLMPSISSPEPPQEWVVDIAEGPDRVTLSVSGEVDVGTSLRFESALVGALASAKPVGLELSGVSFMDSTGLRTLLSAMSRCCDGQTITISRASRQVRRLLEITGLTHTLMTEPEPTAR